MRESKKYNRYIAVLANLLLLTAVGFFVVALFGKPNQGEANIGSFATESFNEDWILYLDGAGEEVTLPQSRNIDRETEIVLEKVLPDTITDGMQIFFRSLSKDIYCFINGELREKYSCDDFWYANDNLPSAYVALELTAEDAGKELRVEMGANSQVRLGEVRIGYGNNVWFSLIQSYLPAVVIAFLLVICGILAMLVQPVFVKLFHAGNEVFLLGQVILTVGCWMLSESRIRQLIFHSPSYSTVFAYLFLEIIGGFTVMYINAVQKYKYNRIYCLYNAVLFGIAAVNTVLDITGLIDYKDTLLPAHIWLVCGGIMVTITAVSDYKAKRLQEYFITACGMAVFVVFCIAEAVNYYLSQFPVLGIYIGIGLLILLGATIIQIIKDESEKVKQAEALAREKEDAENANREKSRFLARVSHEIRTPVNTVIGQNEMILRESRETGTLQYANDVKDASMALLDIINELLEVTELEADAGHKKAEFTADSARVLVVDDYRMNLKVFRNLVKDNGIQVREAESGQECIDILRRETFDLIFLDHMMPGMDGIETLHCIRTEHLCDEVPVIILTANATTGSRERFLAEGFRDFLSKPIVPDRLDSVLLQYLPKEKVLMTKQEEERTETWDAEENDVIEANDTMMERIKAVLPELDYETALKNCVNDEELFLELLQDFSELGIKEELIQFLEEEDFKNYCIRVHGFKNNAYTVGAKELGNLAFEMEQMTKSGMTDGIADKQKVLFAEYDRICEAYRTVR